MRVRVTLIDSGEVGRISLLRPAIRTR